MLSKFIPKTEPYFSLLSTIANKVHQGGELFYTIFQDWKKHVMYAEKIKEIETQCDTLVDTALEKLNTTFITPIDREDIHRLFTELDNIIDIMNGLARKFDMYGIKKPRPEAESMAKILLSCTQQIKEGFHLLETEQKIGDHAKAIHKLESQADLVYREAVTALFKKEKDPIEVVRWNAIFEALEDSIDQCKHLATYLESVVVKNR